MRTRRALFVASALALVWAFVIALTGGVSVRIGVVRLSSRHPLRLVLFAIAAAMAAFVSPGTGGLRSALTQDWEWCRPAVRAVFGTSRRAVAWRIAIAIAAAGILIDVYQWLGALPLWLDEEMIALNIRDRSFAELAGPLWLEQSAPYGWLVLMRAVLLTLGDGERALRLTPLVFGVATVLGALWVGRRWLGPVGMPGLVLLCWITPWLSHYRFEVKHYTADVFFGLMLPALAVWALEGESARQRVRRAVIWWAAAAVGQWLSNGALLVTPGCAALLLASIWRRDGGRASALAAVGGLFWFVNFAGHYDLSLRYTGSLRTYWSSEFPPHSTSIGAAARWGLDRLELLAGNPAGTSRWLSLWILSASGFAFGAASSLAIAFAIVPASAFAYAELGFVPLYQRFSIWFVPALYVGLMLLADRATQPVRPAWQESRWIRLAVSAAILIATIRLGSDIVIRGARELNIPHGRDKQQLDDRAASRQLLAERESDDVVMTTRLGWPAIWWYGRMSIGDDAQGGNRKDSYEMTYLPPGHECHPPPLARMSARASRLLVYLGFRDVPDGFEALLMQSLAEEGVVTGYQRFAGLGRTVVVDLGRGRSQRWPAGASQRGAEGPPSGCIGIQPAHRW